MLWPLRGYKKSRTFHSGVKNNSTFSAIVTLKRDVRTHTHTHSHKSLHVLQRLRALRSPVRLDQGHHVPKISREIRQSTDKAGICGKGAHGVLGKSKSKWKTYFAIIECPGVDTNKSASSFAKFFSCHCCGNKTLLRVCRGKSVEKSEGESRSKMSWGLWWSDWWAETEMGEEHPTQEIMLPWCGFDWLFLYLGHSSGSQGLRRNVCLEFCIFISSYFMSWWSVKKNK